MKPQTIEKLDNVRDQALLYQLVSESALKMVENGKSGLPAEYMQQIENDRVPIHLKGEYLEAFGEYLATK